MTVDVITENTAVQNATADNQYTGVVDSFLKEANAITNYGGFSLLAVTKWGASDHNHAVIRFDGLSNIPSNAIVSSAILYLYQAEATLTYSVDLRRMLQAWAVAGVTWNTYDGTNNWNTGGAEGAGTDRVSAVESSTSLDTTLEYKALDCTSLVQDIIDGTIASDEGFHLERADAGEDAKKKDFISSDGTDGQRPELVVTYTIGASITDVNTDEVIDDAEQNNVATTSGFPTDPTTVKLKSGTAETEASVDSSVGGVVTFDMPDVSGYVVDTVGCPLSTTNNPVVIEISDA